MPGQGGRTSWIGPAPVRLFLFVAHTMFFLRYVLLAVTAAGSVFAADEAYLFTYFTGNGADGLHLAWSDDGYRWRPIAGGESILAPEVGGKERLMRDPCVARGPDGVYHMVWTTGWNENHIGYASTKDFVDWTAQRALPVMAHEPSVRNSWAPEVIYDEPKGEFLIFWASTLPDRFKETAGTSESAYNHRIYATRTRDFRDFTPTRLFYDPGFSVIDATFLRSGSRTFLIIKDETVTPPKKYLQLAETEGLQGAVGALSPPFTPGGMWVEGPTAIKVGEDYLVYFDAYTTHRYGAMRSKDLKTWEDVSSQMSFPFEGTRQRMRHGTVFVVPAALARKLSERTNWPQRPTSKPRPAGPG
jgi:hypothetical protein